MEADRAGMVQLYSPECLFTHSNLNTRQRGDLLHCQMRQLCHRSGSCLNPNQKACITGQVRAKLRAQTANYNYGGLEEYRKCRYGPQSAIKSAERQYRDTGESNYRGLNTRNMWSGIRASTG